MAVKIGSARIDERGKASGGKAGDQTGKEVSTQNWYLHEKGWRVFRCVDPEKAERIADAMAAACANPNIGYDQGQRLTLYTAAKPLLFDPGRVRTACETDCSALVRVCLAYAGILVSNFRTPQEPNVLLATGLFREMAEQAAQRSDYLRRGDILVTKTQGHTVVALSDGPEAGSGERPFRSEREEGCAEVRGGTWHIRKRPDVQAGSLGYVRKGERLRVYGERNGWVAVKSSQSGLKGWVSKKAL